MSSTFASPGFSPLGVGRAARPTHVTPAHAARRHARLELRRLKRHFARVLETLAARDVSVLSPAQRAARAGHLAELRRYARRGRFPKNSLFAAPTPFFVDAAGTRCAMAHLIEATGAVSFVKRIAESRNNAFIRELADDPALHAWLDREGLTVQEAAMIQPSYCSSYAAECLCSYATYEVLEVLVEAIDAEGVVTGRVTAVHGTSDAEVGDPITANSYLSGIVEGDTVLVSSSMVLYPLTPDGASVETSACDTAMFGAAPDTAPKDAAIANILGEGSCGEGLGAEWTAQIGDCNDPNGSGPTTGGGDGGDGEGGGDTIESGGCSIPAPSGPISDAGLGAALLGATVLLGAVKRARRRTPRR